MTPATTMAAAIRTAAIALLFGFLVGHPPHASGQTPAVLPKAVPPAAPPVTNAPTKLQYSDHAMGTNVTVWFWTADERGAAQAAEAVFGEMRRLDKEMTNWPAKPGEAPSEVWQINQAAGDKPVKVSAETFRVIERAVDISKRSNGLFDITVGAFKGLWKFDDDLDGTLPDPADVRQRLTLVNWKDIVLDPRQRSVLLRRKGMAITLGGIAKGYAVDRCVELLRARGFRDFMMQAGGDMYIAGKKANVPWVVAIRDPRGPTNSAFAVAPVENHSFSTSGDYERGFVKDGVRYHHILDPRTGQPAHASRSVTIRAKDAFTADAWSKVMFIMGHKDAIELVKREQLTDFEVVWVDDRNQIVITDGLKAVVQVLKQPTPGP
ncbi:MAG TPA: FAD:protein FMN transferase [Kofleriaceae bacterium]|jgi:thiamine biosynthesis lipoprotein|nr:FAD:protein FMN transferase [Kofleriaceae bacterium]